MAKKFQFQGFDDLVHKLHTLKDPKEIGATLSKGVRAAMAEPRKRARALIPVGIDAHYSYKGNVLQPGFAKKSIRVIVVKDRNNLRARAILGVRAEAFYAVQYVEIGTAKMAAHPWLRPAFAASKDPMIRALGADINTWLKGVAARHAAEGNTDRASQLLSTIE